ncbi:uncharacterized protein LOC133917782 [Phragmites australis]|uniref:uncharacterized protein LOC133917782 n=1 Tax=Phragmites australis TaxID=29695 RepID=UPI002D7978C4|nr:uncharacterized protein LOC133917782 [Phragmites australis]
MCDAPASRSLLMLYAGTPASETTTTVVVQVDVKKGDAGNSSGSLLDVSQHPDWPNMEKALEATILKKMEDVGITSFLHGASVDDMRHARNKYLYLAIVHASFLGSRCRSEDVGTISLLGQKIERLEAEKKDLRVKLEALAKEKEEMTVSAANCAAGKENDEALERANTRIAELERQLQDKKAFADSPLSEVANADAHLKACSLMCLHTVTHTLLYTFASKKKHAWLYPGQLAYETSYRSMAQCHC